MIDPTIPQEVKEDAFLLWELENPRWYTCLSRTEFDVSCALAALFLAIGGFRNHAWDWIEGLFLAGVVGALWWVATNRQSREPKLWSFEQRAEISNSIRRRGYSYVSGELTKLKEGIEEL